MHTEINITNPVTDRINRIENGLIPAIQLQGIPVAGKNILSQMNALKIPAVSIAVINNGKIEWTKAYGVLSTTTHEKVDIHTCFQAGSVSKPVAAFAILSLVDEGLINLNEDVNQKLSSWKIPENEHTKIHKVTLRQLLSHSSGLSVVGFDGYRKNENIPTILQTLDGLPPANNPPVRVEFTPFSKMSYSGGGYNVAQQLVEDVTKVAFQQFMQKSLLTPLKMDRSTFDFVDDVLRSIACEYDWPSYSVKTKSTISLSDEVLDKYIGRYGWGTEPNDIYDLFIFREKNELWLKAGSASNANRLYPEAINRFFLIDTGYDVFFSELDEQVKKLTIIVQPGFEREFKKITL